MVVMGGAGRSGNYSEDDRDDRESMGGNGVVMQ